MTTRPFDEADYPIQLTRALADVVALARQYASAGERLTNRKIAADLEISLNAAYI